MGPARSSARCGSAGTFSSETTTSTSGSASLRRSRAASWPGTLSSWTSAAPRSPSSTATSAASRSFSPTRARCGSAAGQTRLAQHPPVQLCSRASQPCPSLATVRRALWEHARGCGAAGCCRRGSSSPRQASTPSHAAGACSHQRSRHPHQHRRGGWGKCSCRRAAPALQERAALWGEARPRHRPSPTPAAPAGSQLAVRRPLRLDERMVALAAAISIDYGQRGPVPAAGCCSAGWPLSRLSQLLLPPPGCRLLQPAQLRRRLAVSLCSRAGRALPRPRARRRACRGRGRCSKQPRRGRHRIRCRGAERERRSQQR